jgi:non-specific serine/threonine protein kinase/serine/threonine-protein kinase
VADARQKFANIELMRGNRAHAAQLLTQAEAFWASVPTRYAEERLEGLGLRARERRAAGDLEGAIDTMRTAIDRRLALSGRVNRETAVLYNSFGIILTAAHRLDEALDAYRETAAIYHALGLGGEIDSQIVAANMGGLLVRTGHLREAETMLIDAIQHQRELAGNSGALASALGYYGRLLALTDRSEPAATTLREATAVAAQYTGPASPLTVQNRLFLGEAQLTARDFGAAQATLTENDRIAFNQYGANHPLTLRTRLALARLSLAQGHASDAQVQLAAILPGLRQNGAQTVEELAQASNLIHPAELAK